MASQNVTTVVVTYNRVELLKQCLLALSMGAMRPGNLLVVDNASTDGTSDWLRQWLPANLPETTLLAMDCNTGGAGGFSAGLKKACDEGADWVWMMDDDAAPHPFALKELMRVATDPRNIYGSLATNAEFTSWATTLCGPPKRTVQRVVDVPDQAEVESLPFLGFLIHRDLVERIGLPDEGFFIAADDVEYCVRASRAGAKLIIAGKSHIEHPRTQRHIARMFGNDVAYLRLVPWKRYYDTRNRLLVARQYYGIRLLTQTLPGSLVRLYLALRQEPRKLAQLWAFGTGLFDGLLGIKGRRHDKWRIRQ